MNENENALAHWGEETSVSFLKLGELFVPQRAEQIATLLDLLPASLDETFTVVELGADGGALAQAVLERFPHCHYVALDGSETMREHLAYRLESFGDRLEVRPFELAEPGWRSTLPSRLRCVLSSLCVHHLTGPQKRQFFVDMVQSLEPGGTLLLADVVQPASQRVADLFARQYDEIIRAQSMALRGNLSGYEQFDAMHWNYFRYDYNADEPDPIDHPDRLNDQLRWLDEAGFSSVDCFWMQAGHAIFGGYK